MEKEHNLSESLSKLQKEANKSQAEFAKEMGVPKSTFGTILRTGNTTVDTLLRISEHTGLTPNELLGYDYDWRAVFGLMEHIAMYSQLPSVKQEMAKNMVIGMLEMFKNDRWHCSGIRGTDADLRPVIQPGYYGKLFRFLLHIIRCIPCRAAA